MREIHRVKARLTPIAGEFPPLFTRWDPTTNPPKGGIYIYWSHLKCNPGIWTLVLESPTPVGEVGHDLKDAYDVAVYFMMSAGPHDILASGRKFTLTIGDWKKAELEIL